DAIDRAAVDRGVSAARHSCRAGRILDPAAPRRARAPRAMTAWGLPSRTSAAGGLSGEAAPARPARSMLAVAGVTVIGALLFNMLLLSRGLLVSFRDLLDNAGYDIRVIPAQGSMAH